MTISSTISLKSSRNYDFALEDGTKFEIKAPLKEEEEAKIKAFDDNHLDMSKDYQRNFEKHRHNDYYYLVCSFPNVS